MKDDPRLLVGPGVYWVKVIKSGGQSGYRWVHYTFEGLSDWVGELKEHETSSAFMDHAIAKGGFEWEKHPRKLP